MVEKIQEWKELHSIFDDDVGYLVSLIKDMRCDESGTNADPVFPVLTAQEAWCLSSRALSSKFSDVAKSIKDVELKCTTDLNANKDSQPYTIDP